jgi:hypothetical protein
MWYWFTFLNREPPNEPRTLKGNRRAARPDARAGSPDRNRGPQQNGRRARRPPRPASGIGIAHNAAALLLTPKWACFRARIGSFPGDSRNSQFVLPPISMKLLADRVEIGDGPWAVFHSDGLFKFAPRLRLCSLLAPHALPMMGRLLTVKVGRRFTSGVRLIGRMGTAVHTAADMDVGMIAGSRGQHRRCQRAGSSGRIRTTSTTIACVTAAATHRISATFTARRRSSRRRHTMVRIMAATTCRMDTTPLRMETGPRMGSRFTFPRKASRRQTN